MIREIEEKKQMFLNKCSQSGLKITPQRSIIYEELVKSKDHPSVNTLYQRVRKSLPNISFNTVYKTLLSFSKIGIVRPAEGYEEGRRFDPDMNNHHHLHCIRCQKIIDFTNASYDSIKVPSKLNEEFAVLNKKVVLEGICKQ